MSSDSEMDSSAALKVEDEQFTPTQQPAAPRNRATNRPVTAPALHHTTFTTKRLDEMVAWYERAVGLVPVFYGEDAAWLTNDEANHRMAFLSPPGLKHPEDKGTPQVSTTRLSSSRPSISGSTTTSGCATTGSCRS